MRLFLWVIRGKMSLKKENNSQRCCLSLTDAMDCWGLVQTKVPASVFIYLFFSMFFSWKAMNPKGLYENYVNGGTDPYVQDPAQAININLDPLLKLTPL